MHHLIYPQKNAVLSCEADFMQSLAGMEELKDSPRTISWGHEQMQKWEGALGIWREKRGADRELRWTVWSGKKEGAKCWGHLQLSWTPGGSQS